MLGNINYNPDVLSCLANLSNDEVFTPPSLANQMLDLLPQELFRSQETKIVDPFCKSGVFLREAAKRLIDGLANEIPDLQQRLNHIYQNQLFGLPITELTSLTSRRTLYCSKYANSLFSVCTTFTDAAGNLPYERSEHNFRNGRCTICGATEEVYGRDDTQENYAYPFFHTDTFSDMKFDVIIGNPPYQLSDGGFGTSAQPLYHKFVEKAKTLNPRYLCMIIPARWYSGGKGLDEFRQSMLNDKHIQHIHDYPEAADVFPGVQIKGGVCYFLWNKLYEGDVTVTTHMNDQVKSIMTRPLLEDGCKTFVRFNEAISILNKVKRMNEPTLDAKISSSKPFGFRTNFTGNKSPSNGSVKLYQNGGYGYISRDKIEVNRDLVDKWKVLIAPLGSGSDSFPHPVLAKPFVAEPESACTETYLVASFFSKRETAENLCAYLQTSFLRFLVLLNKPAQHATSKVYAFVPQQDLTEVWTDEKLYTKYGITAEEQAFIDTLVRPMQ